MNTWLQKILFTIAVSCLLFANSAHARIGPTFASIIQASQSFKNAATKINTLSQRKVSAATKAGGKGLPKKIKAIRDAASQARTDAFLKFYSSYGYGFMGNMYSLTNSICGLQRLNDFANSKTPDADRKWLSENCGFTNDT